MSTVYKKIDQTQLDNNLSLIANKLKERTNISKDNLIFPEDFSLSLNNSYKMADWLNKTKPVGTITSSKQAPGFSYCIAGRTGITQLNFPNATTIGANYFRDCSSLISIYAPNVTKINGSAFMTDPKIEYAIFPSLQLFGGNDAFNGCYLKGADFGGISTGPIKNGTFQNINNTGFQILILRSSTLWELENVSAAIPLPFRSGKNGAILYVPTALIDSYKAATNWSTILSYTKSDGETLQNQILPIEESFYETHYVDGTPIPTE